MASDTREPRIIAAVPCPTCAAKIGESCRNPVAHQQHRGPEDHRTQPIRCHAERRRAWQEQKRGLDART
jgi:hypothetical protein